MTSRWKSHIVVSGSIEHRLLSSASADTSRTRHQLLAAAIQGGLKFYDDQTVTVALRRLRASDLLVSGRRAGSLFLYRRTPQGEHMLQILAQST